jgi:hypothetical protein
MAIMEKNLQDNEIWNCDRSQLSYEMSSNRTLTLEGGKNTFTVAHTFSTLTHPYTIDIAISVLEK